MDTLIRFFLIVSSVEKNDSDEYESNMGSFSASDSLNFSLFQESSNIIFNQSTEGTSDKQSELIKREEGKKTQNKSLLKKKRRKPHDKYAKDNIKRKIQIVYLHFLVNFVNLIIREIFRKFNGFNWDFQNKEIKGRYQFKKLDYDFAKKIDKKSFNLLKSKTLKEIFKDNTSRKFKSYKNDEVYDNVSAINDKIDYILNQKYLEFFRIFYQKKNYTNLSKYDLDIDISLENIKKFEFFKNKELEKIKEPENQSKYVKRIEESIRNNFMINSHLFIVKK
jgi:hypothetical protein